MKKILTGFLAGIIVSLSVTAFAQSSGIRLEINGVDITSRLEDDGITPTIINDRVFVPARYVAENLDAEVDWDEDTQTVIVTSKRSTAPTAPAETGSGDSSTGNTGSGNVTGTAATYSVKSDKSTYTEGDTAILTVNTNKAATKAKISDASGNVLGESDKFTSDSQGNYFDVSVQLNTTGRVELTAQAGTAAAYAMDGKKITLTVESDKADIEIKDVKLDKTTVNKNETVYVTVKTSADVAKIAVADSNEKVIKTKTSAGSKTTSTWTWTINFAAESSTGTTNYYILAYDDDDKYVTERFTVKVDTSTSSSSDKTDAKISNISLYPTRIYENDDIEVTVTTNKEVDYIEILDNDKRRITSQYSYDTVGNNYEWVVSFYPDDAGRHYVRAYDYDGNYVDQNFTVVYRD